MRLQSEHLYGPWRVSGSEVNYETCPICGGQYKLYINRHTGAWHCFAGRHSGNRSGVFDPTGMPWHTSVAAAPSLASTASREVDIPILSKIANNKLASDYLKSRYITDTTILQLGLADWVEQRRIFIPFVGENGDIIAYSGRDYTGTSSLKYRNSAGAKELYVPDRTVGSRAAASIDVVVAVEGPFDAIACYQAGPMGCRVCALGGKTATGPALTALQEITRAKRVIVWLDQDARGDAVRLALQLGPHTASVQVYWHESCKDAAAVQPEELARILQGWCDG